MGSLLLSTLARLAIGLISSLPLPVVARLGRLGGGVFYYLDARHRRVAQKNLSLCFPEKSADEVGEIARENFRRIGENMCCAIKSASMTEEEMADLLEVHQSDSPSAVHALKSKNVALATGHFGCFELFSRVPRHFPRYRFAATYRGIRQKSIDQVVVNMRSKHGMGLYERRDGADALKKELSDGGLMLVLLADQSDRANGVELPFFGRPAFVNRAPAVMAVRYNCALFVPICYRVRLGRYRLEMGEPIPTRAADGSRRSCEEITRDINAAYEAAIRRDPANWFWVHNRWKTKAVESAPGRQAELTGQRESALPRP